MIGSLSHASDMTDVAIQLKEVVALLTEIRDENRHSTASLKAQMHIMQERLDRIDKISVPSQWTKRTHFDQKIEQDEADLSGSEAIHRECLQENLVHMIESFDLQKTLLLDELIEDNCLTENEASRIRDQTDHRNQTRALTLVIGRRSKNKFQHFLRRVQKEYPEVYDRLIQSYKSKVDEGKRPSQCLICVIKRDVDIRDVVDKLCSKSVVDLQFLEHICTSPLNSLNQANADLWDLVFVNIDRSQDRKSKINILIEALYDKYERISAKLGVWHRPKLVCHCSLPLLQNWLTSHKNFNDSITSLTSEISSTSDTDMQNWAIRQGTTDDSLSSLDESNIPATVQELTSNWVHEQSLEVFSLGARSTTNTISNLDDTLKNLSIDEADSQVSNTASAVLTYKRQDTLPFGENSFSHTNGERSSSFVQTVESPKINQSTTVNTTVISTNYSKHHLDSGSQEKVCFDKRKVFPKQRKPSQAWAANHGHRRSKSDGLSEIKYERKDKQQNNPKNFRRNTSMQGFENKKRHGERLRCTSENDIRSELHRYDE